MKQTTLTIKKIDFLTPDIYRLSLKGDVSEVKRPGQFADILLPETFLRRPISVSMKEADTIDLIIRIAGEGTRKLSTLTPGTKLNVLTGLGNGFNTAHCGKKPLILAGGVGAAPMVWLIRELSAIGVKPRTALGFSNRKEAEAFSRFFPKDTYIATMDGSFGIKGSAADIIRDMDDYTYFFVSGPTPMIKALNGILRGHGEISLEARMGCGFGACMGCSIHTAKGAKKVCSDGPVFRSEELIWEDLI